jgi:hypothetical protein
MDVRLWCYLEGDDRTFLVKVSPHYTIHELKEEIYHKNKKTLARCDADAKQLDLQKIDVDPRDSSIQDLIKNGQYRPPSNQWLDSMKPISNVWPEQPSGERIHVFVSVSFPASASVLGKRSRAADDSMLSDFPWLAEVHSKVWNREGLKPQLFRAVKVTQEDYAKLQECLKEVHQNRGSPYDHDFVKKADVERVKLDFLRSLTPAVIKEII